jgi:hypothetical protein
MKTVMGAQAPDSHTLLTAPPVITVSPLLIKNLRCNVNRDFSPVALMVIIPRVPVVGA